MKLLLQYLMWMMTASLISSSILAQTTITGTIKDKYYQPLAGASVLIKGTRIQTLSDSAGAFTLSTTEKGNKTIMVTYTGYKKFELAIMLTDTAVQLEIVLQESGVLNEVVVSAGSFEASEKAKGASLTPIDAMTNAGSMGDLANSMKALPGTQQIAEQDGLFVRGGTGTEAKQFMDGALIPNPQFSPVPGVPQYSRISSWLFKGIVFSTGGYSALYGQAMSSALILESVDLPDVSSAGFHLFPTSMGANIQQVAKDKRKSYGAGFRYGNPGFYYNIVKQRPEYFSGPENGVADLNVRMKTGKTGLFKFYVNYAFNNVGMRNPDVDSQLLKSTYHIRGKSLYSNISYRENFRPNWRMELVAAYNYNRDFIETGLQGPDNVPVKIPVMPFAEKYSHLTKPSHMVQGRAVLHHTLARSQAIRFGAEHFYTEDEVRLYDTVRSLQDNLTAVFAEGDLRLGQHIAARVGARFEYASLLREASLSPRISLAYRLSNKSQISVAYGTFYQKPENVYLFRQPAPGSSRADHYIVNFTRKNGNRLLRLEAYYKKYHHLVKTVPDINNNGTGYAKGIEFFWRDKRTIKNLDYWITYTYLHTKREYLHYPGELAPTFAAPHTGTVVVKRYFEGISTSVNLAWYFATGRPYYDIRNNPALGKPFIYDQGTTKTYHTLNLSMAYMTSLFKKWKNKDFTGIGFGVNNILGTKQVFGYNYSSNGMNKVPILLPATRMVYLGIFVNFGIDRRDDFLNDNL